MKKTIFFIVFVLLIACMSFAWAQTVYYANQITIAWDPVTTYENGQPITGGTVRYEIYLKAANEQKIGETAETQYTITLSDYQVYDVGVKALWNDGTTDYESTVTWSSIEGTPAPFVVQRYPAPAKVQNLRIK